MSPIMRSIFAQLYQKSRWMGGSRNFSSSPTNFKESKSKAVAKLFVTRTVGIAFGYLIGHYVIGDLDKIFEKKLEEDIRKAEENVKMRDKRLAFHTKVYNK